MYHRKTELFENDTTLINAGDTLECLMDGCSKAVAGTVHWLIGNGLFLKES